MNQTFKVGDKVYCPIAGTKIYTLEENLSNTYSVKIFSKDDIAIFTKDGKYSPSHQASNLFHATKENHELLSKLYGMKFEEPKSFLDHHLSLGSKVLCLIAKEPNDLPNKIWELKSHKHSIDVIVEPTVDNKYKNDEGFTIRWDYFYPIEVTSTGQINYLS